MNDTTIGTLIERLETNEGCLCSCTPEYSERGLRDPSCGFCDTKVMRDDAAEALRTQQAENEKLKKAIHELVEDCMRYRQELGLYTPPDYVHD